MSEEIRENIEDLSKEMPCIPKSVVVSFSSEDDLSKADSPRYIYRNTTQGTLYIDRTNTRQKDLMNRFYQSGFPVILDDVDPFESSPILRVGSRHIVGFEDIQIFLNTLN